MKSIFREIWLFLTSGLFLGTLAKMIGLMILLYFITVWGLRCFTNHGESVQVDDFTGMHLSDAKRKARSKGFRFEVLDSTWMENKPSGLILTQDPKALSFVKEGRKIYVSVTGDPKEFYLPLFSESSYDFEQYSRRLELRHGIKAVIKERVFDAKLSENSILHLYYDGEKIGDEEVKEGVKVQEGATLEFVITERRTNEMNLPNLVCLGFEAADFLATSYNLAIGQIFEDESVLSREKAYVVKQDPPFADGATIMAGSQINVWLTQNPPEDCP